MAPFMIAVVLKAGLYTDLISEEKANFAILQNNCWKGSEKGTSCAISYQGIAVANSRQCSDWAIGSRNVVASLAGLSLIPLTASQHRVLG